MPLGEIYPESMDFGFQRLIISSAYDNDIAVIGCDVEQLEVLSSTSSQDYGSDTE